MRGPEDLTQTADQRHHVRSGDAAIEIDLASHDLFHQVFGANDIGTSLAGFFGLGILGEHGDAHGLAGAVRQVHHAADHLVGVARIDTQVDGDFDGLVELGRGASLDHLDGFIELVELVAVDAFAGLDQLLTNMCHLSTLDLNAHGTGRAGDHRHRGVDIVGVEILHLLFGDIAQLSRA